MAMQGIAAVLGGKETSSLLGQSKAKEKTQAGSFLQALQGSGATQPQQQTEPTSTANAADKKSATALDANNANKATEPSPELWDKFKEFVGNTLFGQMLTSMRKTQEKPAYFHGGQTEEIFQQQLDQKLVEHVTEGSAERYIAPMFEHFKLMRSVDVQA